MEIPNYDKGIDANTKYKQLYGYMPNAPLRMLMAYVVVLVKLIPLFIYYKLHSFSMIKYIYMQKTLSKKNINN